MIPKRLFIRQTALAGCALLLSGAVMAQAYPSRPITLVVPNPPGGFVDASARLIS
ncbi:MAG: putative extracytoplasmic binding receptor, partial [Pseudomonadota bacterium]